MSCRDDEKDDIEIETMEISIALICQISSQNPNYIRIKNQVDRIIHRHEILFTGMLRKLNTLTVSIDKNDNNYQDIIYDQLCNDLTRIFNYLIQNDHITWGKIITIFAFSTFIARKHNEIADRIAYVTGNYIIKNLITWIKLQGGWDSMAFLDSPYDIDNLSKIFTFSLTCIGLSLIGLFLVLR